MFAPFFVAVALVVSATLYPFTGVGPSNKIFALCALAAIVLGIAIGVVALCRAKIIRVWWRLLIGLLYLPTALFSLLLAGY